MRARRAITTGVLASIAAAAGALLGPAAAPRAGASHEAPPSAADCGRCHTEHLAEHQRSAHARAFEGALFQREWRDDPRAFCLGCHAPGARPGDLASASAGVDCAACHLEAGSVRASAISGRAPHASHVDASFGTAAACAGCHQIDARPGVPMQDTVAEWREAGEPGGACQPCHMPSRPGGHRHDAPGGADPELLARALAVEATAAHEGWDTRVSLTLRAEGAGHAVPTGDVFRRLVVRAWDPSRPGEERSVELGRRITPSSVADDRVPPPGRGAREVTLRVPGRARQVRFAVELWPLPRERAAHAGARGRTMAEGHLTIAPSP